MSSPATWNILWANYWFIDYPNVCDSGWFIIPIYVGHCPLSELYFICMMFQELALLPASVNQLPFYWFLSNLLRLMATVGIKPRYFWMISQFVHQPDIQEIPGLIPTVITDFKDIKITKSSSITVTNHQLTGVDPPSWT